MILNVLRSTGCRSWGLLTAKIEKCCNFQNLPATCQRLCTGPPTVGGRTALETQQMHASKKKTVPIQKVTVILPNEQLSVLSLEGAQKLAKRRNLQLVKVEDAKTESQRDTYKLKKLPQSVVDDESDEKVSTVKGKKPKMIVINEKINQNDLTIKMEKLKNFLQAKRMVKVILLTDKENSAVLQTVEAQGRQFGNLLNKGYSEGRYRILFDAIKSENTPPEKLEVKDET